jgi:hypothetical protein
VFANWFEEKTKRKRKKENKKKKEISLRDTVKKRKKKKRKETCGIVFIYRRWMMVDINLPDLQKKQSW